VIRYLPLVKITVGRLGIMVPQYIEREEMYSAGVMGLLSAIERYDPGREAKFTTYAITRIRGAILDELRAHDTLGRVTRERLTRIQNAERDLRGCGQEAPPEAVARKAGLTLDEYWDAEVGSLALRQISLSEVMPAGERALEDILTDRGEEQPAERLAVEELIRIVRELLSDKERELVVLYYQEGLTLKEIGEIFHVSESRVCQMHAAMVARIRKKLEKMGIPL